MNTITIKNKPDMNDPNAIACYVQERIKIVSDATHGRLLSETFIRDWFRKTVDTPNSELEKIMDRFYVCALAAASLDDNCVLGDTPIMPDGVRRMPSKAFVSSTGIQLVWYTFPGEQSRIITWEDLLHVESAKK